MSSFVSPVVVEPIVSREKLEELLGWGAEYPEMDFKRELAVDTTEGLVELAKDIGAMQVRGGYILIGVDGHGDPSGRVDVGSLPQYDEARLAPRLLRYLPEPLELRTSTFELDAGAVALIYVGPHPSGCAFFRADGQYPRGSRSVVVFRAGDVFWRDGTRSVRLSQQGLEEVISHRVEKAKQTWIGEHGELWGEQTRELVMGGEGRRLADAPIGTLTMSVDAETLVTSALELLRRNDVIPLRHLFVDAVASARRLVDGEDFEVELGVMVDKLTCLGSAAMVYDQADLLRQVIRCLRDIFLLGYTPDFSAYSVGLPNDLRGPRVWLLITERVYGLGALAVRTENWHAARELAVQPVPNTEQTSTRWLRHGLTMASRAGHLTTHTSGREERLSLLSLARTHVDRLECLRSDGIDRESDVELTSLAQFDLLVALAVIASEHRVDSADFYTNFARFYSERVIPIVERVIQPDSHVRETIFPSDDAELASALTMIAQMASQEGWSYSGFRGFGRHVDAWIAEHRTGDR